jgi:hypothetical protein
MLGKELLETYSKAGEIVIKYYVDQFISSLEKEDVSDEVKEYAKGYTIDTEYIAKFIDINPRGLFDVFDNNDIYINVTAFPNSLFHYSIVGDVITVESTETFFTRIEAEKLVIEKAFEILNNKL